jgi:dihydrofolate reductase
MDAPLQEFVTTLKQTEGGEISLMASISLVRQLLFAGLLDSLTLMVHPVVAGEGRPILVADDPGSRQTSAGNTILRYARRAD